MSAKTRRQTKWRLQKGRCFYCGDYMQFEDATTDHLIPLFVFRQHKELLTKKYKMNNGHKNIVASCLDCNKGKSNYMPLIQEVVKFCDMFHMSHKRHLRVFSYLKNTKGYK